MKQDKKQTRHLRNKLKNSPISMFRIDETNFIILQDDVDQIQSIEQAQKELSATCINEHLELVNEIPKSRQLAIKLKAKISHISILCDSFEIMGKGNMKIYSLPVCFNSAKVPVIGVIVQHDKTMCLLSGELLSDYLSTAKQVLDKSK